ncbi:MAG: hypothetical protein KatS3mg003_0072 [Candidatus Nitrosocaldaceae archaeon]|nr:MAG: hypothetical protein KatS3mg003_0072 [Candidatus Nitrosocaldaceae archaeon]
MSKYKQESLIHWNEFAETYHKLFALRRTGPFSSIEELLRIADIKEGDYVVDIATGSGAVAREVIKVTKHVIGIDLARNMLKLAKDSNLMLLQMDAEHLGFKDDIFDLALCQFGFMLFPNHRKALYDIKRVLKDNGRFICSVHGSIDKVPYFRIISEAILKNKPDAFPKDRPNPTRFGDISLLTRELRTCFDKIKIYRYNYYYRVGSFEEYWRDFLNSLTYSMKERLKNKLDNIKEDARRLTIEYIDNEGLEFPWEVIIAEASK